MKKLIFFTLCLSLCFGAVAEGIGLRINVHPVGYMNHLVRTEHDKNGVAAALQVAFDNLTSSAGTLSIDTSSTEYYNSFAVGLDVAYSYFYYSMSLGFPTGNVNMTGFDPIVNTYEKLFTKWDKITGTILMDNQLGGGITLLETMPVNIYVGGGIAVNYLHVKRHIADPSSFVLPGVTNLYEIRDIAQFGLGVRCSVDYYFLANVGVSLTLTDSLYFANLYSNTKFTGISPDGRSFTYKANSANGDDTGNDNASVKSRIGNNFAIRAGVAFKF